MPIRTANFRPDIAFIALEFVHGIQTPHFSQQLASMAHETRIKLNFIPWLDLDPQLLSSYLNGVQLNARAGIKTAGLERGQYVLRA